ncbi:alkane hydroxylase MAH1-like [Salvia miltiorrhiza]|uniref:alkane hydroxylase MAH1-like n=1 Tax=Salvia miltiorrhiza TaxID=226208 RepID=UPI0025AD6020|nr:alkane hydroxylase MAH1-like [Salvia miltiorrhiza]
MYLEIFLIIVSVCLWRIHRSILNWPLVGMLPSLLLNVGRIHEICTQVLQNCRRGTFHFRGPWFANMDILLTAHPANVHYIMTSNFQNFPKGPRFREMFDVLGDGIFTADSDSWRDQRRAAMALIAGPTFLRFLARVTHQKAEAALLPLLDAAAAVDNRVIDLQDLFQRLTFDTSCVLITGYDPGCLSPDLPHVPFAEAMDAAEESIFMRHVLPERVWKLQRWIRVGSERKLMRARKILDGVIGNLIASKRNNEGDDLLSSYMNMNQDSRFLRDTVLNLMIAGRDTTSSALTWLMWLVSTHPEVEERMRDEVRSAGGGGRRVFGVDEVKKMVYIHGAVLEALRLYPPVPFQHKEALESDILPSGHTVGPDVKVMFSLYAMGRMESIWGDDCLEFRPERWISGAGASIRHTPAYKFLAFNAGPRSCLGKEVALAQIKAVAATLIYNYRFRVAEGHRVEPNCSVILYMRHGLKVKVASRLSRR